MLTCLPSVIKNLLYTYYNVNHHEWQLYVPVNKVAHSIWIVYDDRL